MLARGITIPDRLPAFGGRRYPAQGPAHALCGVTISRSANRAGFSLDPPGRFDRSIRASARAIPFG